MGSGKRNYRALRYSSRKWKKDTILINQVDQEKPKLQTEEQKKAMEELMILFKKKQKKINN